ncbi:MAG: adenylyl-sulfate kinase, partial [Bacteroidota bacterium]
RDIIGEKNIIEVFVNTPLEVCEERDTKGLYKKARSGELKNFTGISSPFEIPTHADIDINTSKFSLAESVEKMLDLILAQIDINLKVQGV